MIALDFNWIDGTLIRYAIGWIVALCGACLFGWWWMKKGSASFVFILVTFWFVGIWIEKTIQVYGRVLRLTTKSTEFSENYWVWEAKGDISTLAQIVIIGYLTLRMVGYFPTERMRRKEDRK